MKPNNEISAAIERAKGCAELEGITFEQDSLSLFASVVSGELSFEQAIKAAAPQVSGAAVWTSEQESSFETAESSYLVLSAYMSSAIGAELNSGRPDMDYVSKLEQEIKELQRKKYALQLGDVAGIQSFIAECSQKLIEYRKGSAS